MKKASMAKVLATIAGVGAASVGSLWYIQGGPATTAPVGSVSGQGPGCHEEEPCWNCATMGNHKCGDQQWVNVTEAENAAYEMLQKVQTTPGTWTCWSEINNEMPKGYETLCERM